MIAILAETAFFGAYALAAPTVDLDESVLVIPAESRHHLVKLDGSKRVSIPSEMVYSLIKHGIGFIDITNHPDLGQNSYTTAEVVDFPSKITQSELVNNPIMEIERPRLFETFTGFYTRFHTSKTGVEGSMCLLDLINGLIRDRSDISAGTIAHWWPQPSIVVRIEGIEDPDSVVILDAHLDSINKDDPDMVVPPRPTIMVVAQ